MKRNKGLTKKKRKTSTTAAALAILNTPCFQTHTGTDGGAALRLGGDVFPGGGAYRAIGSVLADVGLPLADLLTPGCCEAEAGRFLDTAGPPTYPRA